MVAHAPINSGQAKFLSLAAVRAASRMAHAVEKVIVAARLR
jgi:hypothetical protein